MDRNKERSDAHYELWRLGESKASDDRISNLLDLGYSGEEAAGRVHQDRENIRAERATEDQRVMYEEMEYQKYCNFAEEQDRHYQEYAEEEHQKYLAEQEKEKAI